MVSPDPNRARLPPPLLGLAPQWSRLIPVTDANGETHTWHVLDSHASSDELPEHGTILCVHGNPTWSYLWRRLVAAPPPGWRVVAVDQLGMGYSDRTDLPRRLATRIDDLGRLTAELGLAGPVVTVAHDWGGPISLGWALAHRDQVAGIVLTNTAVHQPPGSPAPALIRLAGAPGLRQLICQSTPAFVTTPGEVFQRLFHHVVVVGALGIGGNAGALGIGGEGQRIGGGGIAHAQCDHALRLGPQRLG